MNYRERRGSYLNCEKRIFSGTGPFDFPVLDPVEVDVEGTEVIGFNYAIGEKHPEDKMVHFYLDDYQFERVWNDPNRYVPILARFKAVMAPDFSMYTDFPKAIQIFNHYRKMWCARYWQDHGITVIPCICWSDEASFEWCFDGIPRHAPVCVSTVGGFGNHTDNRERWVAGYRKCLEVLEPSQIILFGKEYPETACECEVQVVPNAQLVRKKTLSSGGDNGGLKILSADMEELEEASEAE